MTQKHKNAEYIIAFANGEEVEWKCDGLDFALDTWRLVQDISLFQREQTTFRMKPKTVKTKGYKRYVFVGDGEYWVGQILEGLYPEEELINAPNFVEMIDKEWQYYTVEEV